MAKTTLTLNRSFARENQPSGDDLPTSSDPGADDAPVAAPTPTKTAIVLDLLKREESASLDELVAATGWLPHTTRAALTGLRKKGYAIIRGKVDGVTRYTIATGVAA